MADSNDALMALYPYHSPSRKSYKNGDYIGPTASKTLSSLLAFQPQL